jgi:hypothetical protein
MSPIAVLSLSIPVRMVQERCNRRREGSISAYCEGRTRPSSPLTPALSPLKGEGVAKGALRGSNSSAAICHRSNTQAPNAAIDARLVGVVRRAPSPLNGERAGVRGETVALNRPGCALRGRIIAALIAALALAAVLSGRAADVGSDFDAANKFYEQGKFSEAAAAYEKLLRAGAPAEVVHFNLGNAWFKAGQLGRAIAEWRLAERSSPRDPNVRFNLQFARKRVTGSDAPAGPLWQRALRSLTLNEWTMLASVSLWIWFLLLALREFKPALRKVLSGYTATAGLGALLLACCLAGAAALQFNTRPAVVIVSEAIARTGPLEEAKVLHQLRDGTEVVVLDEKEITVGDKKQTWLQVRDSARRTGWVKGDQLSVLAAGRS